MGPDEEQRPAALGAEAEARGRLLDAVLEAIDVAVVAADPAGRLTLFNRAAREWHGLDTDPTVAPGDLADRYRLFRADGVTPLPSAESPLLRALHGGRVRGAELIIQGAGGEPRHAVAEGRSLTAADGTPLGAVVAMTDVTADRARQRALAAAHAELLRSHAALEQFAAVVSHDLASPMGVVYGYLELLGDHYRAELDERGQKWVASAMRAVSRIQALIDSLLRCARAGGDPYRRADADLREIVDQALTDLRDPLRESGPTARPAAPPATPAGDTAVSSSTAPGA